MTSRGVDSPTLTAAHLEVFSLLKGAVDGLPFNDFGRPWPAPRGGAIALALTQYPPDICIAAAKEAREIVQSQDRAPNITSLFEKKLRDRAEVRSTVRASLGVAA